MDTEMTRYESFAEVTEDFYCSAVDVLKILVLRLHDYHTKNLNLASSTALVLYLV